jgi:hypothetical protein
LLLRWRCRLAWFLQDVTIANEHGIVQVTLLQARVPAGETEMPGVKPFLQFLKYKEQAFLHLLKLLRRGGIIDIRQNLLSNLLELFVLLAGLVR